MLELNDLLNKVGILPKQTMVFRHRPKESDIKTIFPWIASERPDLFNAYQRSHAERVENSLKRAEFVASFVGTGSDEAVFVGIYRNLGLRKVTYNQFWAIPENVELRKLGMWGMQRDRQWQYWFDLERLPDYADWSGKMLVGWPGSGRSWWRWADRNIIPVRAITEESLLVPNVPTADNVVLNWRELQALPRSWRQAIEQWRGIYLIVDSSDGKAYVGSASGSENIYGRWMNYADTGHGGNALLRKRDPLSFKFSILQLVAQDLDKKGVVALESRWKDRLLTRDFGLNAN